MPILPHAPDPGQPEPSPQPGHGITPPPPAVDAADRQLIGEAQYVSRLLADGVISDEAAEQLRGQIHAARIARIAVGWAPTPERPSPADAASAYVDSLMTAGMPRPAPAPAVQSMTSMSGARWHSTDGVRWYASAEAAEQAASAPARPAELAMALLRRYAPVNQVLGDEALTMLGEDVQRARELESDPRYLVGRLQQALTALLAGEQLVQPDAMERLMGDAIGDAIDYRMKRYLACDCGDICDRCGPDQYLSVRYDTLVRELGITGPDPLTPEAAGTPPKLSALGPALDRARAASAAVEAFRRDVSPGSEDWAERRADVALDAARELAALLEVLGGRALVPAGDAEAAPRTAAAAAVRTAFEGASCEYAMQHGPVPDWAAWSQRLSLALAAVLDAAEQSR